MPIIDRSGAEALMPDDAVREILTGVVEKSTVLEYGRRLPDMASAQRRLPISDALPMAYFNNAGEDPNDISYKRLSRASWKNKFIDAEELSVIIPIPENVLEDADYDIWEQIRPQILEAIGAAIDGAVIFGHNAPNVWPTNIVDAAIAAGNVTVEGTGTDLYDDLLAEDGVISHVEVDGYMPTAHISYPGFRGKLRGLRDLQGNPLFKRSLNTRQDIQATTNYELDGAPIDFMANGAWDNDKAELITGDFRQLVYAIRKDVTTKLLTEAVLQDPETGDIVYNLAQQDMVALRVVMRLGWNVPNPPNRLAPDENTRYPFAVLAPAENGGNGVEG